MGATAGGLRKKLWALGLALGASALAGELLVRLALGAPMPERLPLLHVRANPYRGWEMLPGEHYTYEQHVRVNALGLRGPELADKAPGELRVLFLGDSLTYGQGVGDDETVPFALEQALGAALPGRRVTVVNAGHRAYGTGQELGLLAELGARLAPDLVLLGWYWNDVSEREIPATYEAFRTRGEFAFDTNKAMDARARLLWRAAQLPRRSALVMWLHDLTSSKAQLFSPEVTEAGFVRLAAHLAAFRERCAELGAHPVFVIFPDAKRLVGREDTRPSDERAAGLARAEGLPVIELLPALEPLHAARGARPILPFDGHYDAEANRAMGAYLAARLAALELVPAR
jgi:lysophospholipase L1-like esterase